MLNLSNIKLKPKILMGLLFPLIFVLIMGVISVVSNVKVQENEELVAHTFEVLQVAEEIIASAVDMETGERGYLLAGREEFLEPYQSGELNTYQALNDARLLVSDNPIQVVRFQQAEDILREWQLEITEPLILMRRNIGLEGDLASISAIVGEARGKEYFDRFRAIMTDVLEEERRLMVIRQEETLAFSNLTGYLIWGGGIFAIISVAVLSWIIGNGVSNPIIRITETMRDLASGEIENINIQGTDREDEVGEMASALKVFKEAMDKVVAQNWIRSATSTISSAMFEARSPQAAAKAVLNETMPLLEGGHGMFYRYDDEQGCLKLLDSYAHTERKHVGNEFKLGEGLVGQCAQEEKPITLNEVPDDYVEILSGLGAATPKTIMAYPIMLKDALHGVLEVATFKDFNNNQRSLLKELMPAVALYLDNLTRSQRTETLLTESRQQAEELQVSREKLKEREEELTATNEELRTKTVDLESRTTELEASEVELKNQSLELSASNEDLMKQADDLKEQQKKVEEARKKTEIAARDLERASQYKSQFLATMSHELRTPLNSLLLLAKGLSDNESGKLTNDDIESATIIHESGTNLLRLINDILDLSKIEAGETEVRKEKLTPSYITEYVERYFAHVAVENDITLKVELSKDLPEFIITDQDKVNQIMNNLLSNAFKFTEKGSVIVTMRRLSAGDTYSDSNTLVDDELIAIAVSDTGIGIPDEDKDKVFEAFKQVDGTTARKYGGTGLGLSISRKLAGLLGGDIQVESEIGQGSTFTLYLPEKLEHSEAILQSPSPIIVQNIEVPVSDIEIVADDRNTLEQNDKIIVVIEDDPSFSKILLTQAHKNEFKCLIANDGEIGMSLINQYHPEGVILDIGLPHLDGWSVMARLKDDPATRHIPVYVISVMDEDRTGLRRGAVGYLKKPVTKPQLDEAFTTIKRFMVGAVRKLMIVGDTENARKKVSRLLKNKSVKIHSHNLSKEVVSILEKEPGDCVLVLLNSSTSSTLEFLRNVSKLGGNTPPPIVIYSNKEITKDEELELREFTDCIVIKSDRSDERLVDEITLYLHCPHDSLPKKQQMLLEKSLDPTLDLANKTVLVVDDDMRNTYALSKALRARGLNVIKAKDGKSALKELDNQPELDLVLMDVMMPGMDGNETMRKIREQQRFKVLPIIAVTAKAMKGDREKCMEAGATDYLSKPIDVAKLIPMMRKWI